MDSLPSIAVISCSSTKPSSLIKLITNSKDVIEDPVRSGLSKQKWTIDNKYYTAEVAFIGFELLLDQNDDKLNSLEALIFHMDPNKESGLDDLNKWMYLDQSHNLEVKLLLSNYCTDDTKITKHDAVDWCLKHGFEFIELYPSKKNKKMCESGDIIKEKTGVDRVIEALQCHTWSNLTLKDKDKEQKTTGAHECDDGDDFTELFAQLHLMKDSLQNMPTNQRKHCAEQMVTAFWKAIGGEEEELLDL